MKRFLAFRSLQSRVVVSFLVLITLVQAGSYVAVDSTIQRSARANLKAQLSTTARVFDGLIKARNQRLVEAARILSQDFPFKQVVALEDRATLLSAMDNHRLRIGADLMMLVSLDGSRIVETLHHDPAAPASDVAGGITPLIETARRRGEAADFILLDGRAYQVVVVPLRAPAPIAWIGMGFLVDHALAEELRKTTATHVSFVHADAGGRWTTVASTLPPDGGGEMETLVLPVESSVGSHISVVLQRSLPEAMEAYRYLRTALLLLFALSAAVSIAGGVWIARGVSRPVGQLADAARKIAAGSYGTDVPMKRQDELGALAAAFNHMTRAVAEREAGLRESEERFRTMTESAVDGVVTADAEGRIVSWNRGAHAIFGYAAEDVLGTPLTRLFAERYRGVLQEGLGRTLEVHGLTRGGQEFPSELSLASWETRHGSFRTAIIRDVTERKQLEEQFRQAQKMQSIGRLAGGVAHDFNNLLTVIRGHADLMLRGLEPADPLHHRFSVIQEAATHAAQLTRQLLAFSRKQVLEPRILDLNAVVADVEPMLRRLIGEDVELVSMPAPDLGTVEADPGQMVQIILNLAVNARDAMPQGGKLTVETDNVELDEEYASRHADARPGPYVMLAVSDTGIGMDEGVRSHIFEPFFTTKEPGTGTGLGLATIYGIVKQSNGNIEVYSEPGRGATFKIYLPRVDKAAERVVAAAPPGEQRGSETILLVEDDEMVRTLTCELLKEWGYTVLEARHGEDALDISQRYHGPIHLLLTDVVMPRMGGRDLASRLYTRRPQTKVLFMSGYTTDAIVHHGMLDARVPFLPKPITVNALVSKVREVLDDGAPAPGAAATGTGERDANDSGSARLLGSRAMRA
jgi:PAS domain S-box-containing protein